jgi:thiamine monophosphate synthase
MTKGKALKLSDVERIHRDLIRHEEERLAIRERLLAHEDARLDIAKKHKVTLQTLNKIDRVRKIAGKYGTNAVLRVRRHKVSKQSDQAEC